MTQDHLKLWCLEHDCYIYEEKDNDHGHSIIMRHKDDKSLMAVLFEPKKGSYKPASVCAICNNLNIDVPDFGISMQDHLNEAKANCPKK